jgi:bifunctional DNA-binding transcriptional regulator/antitoxin component of YhaV-PrlF toxin-antitoxin module
VNCKLSLKTKVSVARPGSPSLRATIPEGIVAFLNLKEGDKLEWKMEMIEDKRVAIVEKTISPEEEMTRIKLKYVHPEEKKKHDC